MGFLDGARNRAIRISKGVNMIRITDKSFRYTTSFNTDLRRKFRKLAKEAHGAASSNAPDAGIVSSVVPMVVRRRVPKA